MHEETGEPPGVDHLLERLGTVKSGSACVYVNKLANVDLGVLRELIGTTYRHMTTQVVESLQAHRNL
ncbi:hypothetical protein CVV68_07495 [Arthrobacter livingstonensis]|uniref:Uncharacterized protein n=1 Tax=Arthrobacter livingstonensis TaxID=670078 RepID=A0A2V5LA25_9MICC|nr:hypothetical protein [Arthrobacter livingstonensis]PYI68168.1 hypothetical protein CVV68_07495 [Arthrobacter livingstonensis]